MEIDSCLKTNGLQSALIVILISFCTQGKLDNLSAADGKPAAACVFIFSLLTSARIRLQFYYLSAIDGKAAAAWVFIFSLISCYAAIRESTSKAKKSEQCSPKLLQTAVRT